MCSEICWTDQANSLLSEPIIILGLPLYATNCVILLKKTISAAEKFFSYAQCTRTDCFGVRFTKIAQLHDVSDAAILHSCIEFQIIFAYSVLAEKFIHLGEERIVGFCCFLEFPFRLWETSSLSSKLFRLYQLDGDRLSFFSFSVDDYKFCRFEPA